MRAQHLDAQAFALFDALYQRTRQPRCLAQRALAQGALGRWLDAERGLTEALTRTDPWIEANRASLDAALETIQTHVGTLDVQGGPAGAELWIDGERVATLPLASPVRVLSGTVTFELRAAGHTTVSRTIAVVAGGLSRERVTLVPLRAAPAPIVRGTIPPTVLPSPNRAIATGVAIGAGALTVGGAALLGAGYSQVAAYNSAVSCPGVDVSPQPQACQTMIDAAHAFRAASIVVWALAVAAGGVSIGLWATAPAPRSRASFRCGPLVGCSVSF